MLCPDCGHEVPERLTLCPMCGQSVEQTQPLKRRSLLKRSHAAGMDETMPIPLPVVEKTETAKEEESAAPPRLTFWQRARVVLLAVAIFVCLLAISGSLGTYIGTQHGELTRVAGRIELADEHYYRGLTRLDNGEFELAIAEFEYVLQLDPHHPLARQGLAEANARIAAIPTPTSEPEVDLRPELYEEGRAAYQAQNWARAVEILVQLRAYAPEYETESVADMLFESFYQRGMALLAEDRLEEAIFHLDQASEIRPLEDEALLELELARRYLRALGYWGVNWRECVRRFEALYVQAPGYRDVFTRLFRAYVNYGDLWAAQGEMCPAATQYARALELRNDPEVAANRDEAVEVCAIATPAPITGTLPIDGVGMVPDFRGGRLAYPAYNSQLGVYDIYVVTADGRLARVATGADQPAWQWGTDRLIYRNRLTPGIYTLQLGGEPVLLRADAGAAWPTFSPDGGRYAYAARNAAGTWTIYIARTDGSGEPVAHASGWEPNWGPGGLLAWTGCEDDGTTCGIFVDNPDDGQPPQRLTGNMNDRGTHWAPGGNLLAYMSNHTGSWNVYLLNTGGGVQVVTDEQTIEGLPAWIPDGSGLVFLSYRNNRWGLYLAQLDGTILQNMIDLGGEMPNWQNQRISWTP